VGPPDGRASVLTTGAKLEAREQPTQHDLDLE